MNVGKLIRAYDKHFYLESSLKNAIEVTIATLISSPKGGDPIWLFLVEASSGFKTELIRSFSTHLIDPSIEKHDLVHAVSKLTPNTLVSGRAGRDVDLLPKLHHRCLTIKDFTTILTMYRMERDAIIGQLRDMFDGRYTADYGSAAQHKAYTSSFNVIAGVTPDIDNFHIVTQQLGERFLKDRPRTLNRLKLAAAAFKHSGLEDDKKGADGQIEKKGIRTELQEAVNEFILDKLPQVDAITKDCIYDPYDTNLQLISDFCCRGRTAIIKDERGNLLYEPQPEQPGRFTKQLTKLLASVCFINEKSAVSDREFRIIMNVAFNSLPYPRYKVIESLYNKGKLAQLPLSEIVESSLLPKSTVKGAIADLRILRIIDSIRGVSGEGKDEKAQNAYKLTNRTEAIFRLRDKYTKRSEIEEQEEYDAHLKKARTL